MHNLLYILLSIGRHTCVPDLATEDDVHAHTRGCLQNLLLLECCGHGQIMRYAPL